MSQTAAEVMERMADPTAVVKVLRKVAPATFAFGIPGSPCAYWRASGEHIVAGGACRCGKRFLLAEEVETL